MRGNDPRREELLQTFYPIDHLNPQCNGCNGSPVFQCNTPPNSVNIQTPQLLLFKREHYNLFPHQPVPIKESTSQVSWKHPPVYCRMQSWIPILRSADGPSQASDSTQSESRGTETCNHEVPLYHHLILLGLLPYTSQTKTIRKRRVPGFPSWVDRYDHMRRRLNSKKSLTITPRWYSINTEYHSLSITMTLCKHREVSPKWPDPTIPLVAR